MVGYLSFLKIGPKLLKFLPGAQVVVTRFAAGTSQRGICCMRLLVLWARCPRHGMHTITAEWHATPSYCQACSLTACPDSEPLKAACSSMPLATAVLHPVPLSAVHLSDGRVCQCFCCAGEEAPFLSNIAESRTCVCDPCCCRPEGARSSQLADRVRLLEPGRRGQRGDHAAVPGRPVPRAHRHRAQGRSGDAEHRRARMLHCLFWPHAGCPPASRPSLYRRRPTRGHAHTLHFAASVQAFCRRACPAESYPWCTCCSCMPAPVCFSCRSSGRE